MEIRIRGKKKTIGFVIVQGREEEIYSIDPAVSARTGKVTVSYFKGGKKHKTSVPANDVTLYPTNAF